MEYTTADNFTTSTAVWQMPYVVIARANRLIQAAESGNLTDAAEASTIVGGVVIKSRTKVTLYKS